MIFNLPQVIINMHCHGRDLRQAYKTTVFRTLLESLQGHISITGYMPNTIPALDSAEILFLYLNLINEAKQALHITLPQYVWLALTDDNLQFCKEALPYASVIGLKAYPKLADGKTVTTGSVGVAREETLYEGMKLTREAGKVFAYHGDDPIIIRDLGYVKEAETYYDKKILSLARRVPGVKIYKCHCSCRESAEIILGAQREGIDIALEICPHYLWFDAAGTNLQYDNPDFYKCYNSLRTPEDRKFLISLLLTANKKIIIGADHAPHLREEKLQGAADIPNLYEMVPVILTLAQKYGIPEERAAELLSFNASDIFGIPVPRELVPWEIEEREDYCRYGDNIINPWLGTKLYFPVRRIQ